MAKKEGSDRARELRQPSAPAGKKESHAKATTRIAVKLGEGSAPASDKVLDAWRAAGVGADKSLMDAARRIGEASLGGSAFRDMMAGMASDAKAPISEAVREMAKGWENRANVLQQIQRDALTIPRSFVSILPSPEVSASMAIEAQTERLVDISVRTSEQIGQLAQIAEATLAQQVQGVAAAAETHAESKKLREALVQFGNDAKRSARTQTFLGIVIAILTAVLVMDALNLGPFAAA